MRASAIIRSFRLASRSLIYLICLSAGLLAGCGNSTKEFIHTGTATGTEFAPVSVAGRVAPGVPAVGVPVVVTSDDGTVLAQATTDESGSFLFPGFTGPASFRVSASLDDEITLESQVTNNPGGAFVVLNLPTTLASRLSRAAGVSAEEAKQRVAGFLGLAHVADLEHGLSEFDATGFSHLVFFLRAQQQGGIDAYLDLLVQEIQAGGTPRTFHLSLDDLEATLDLPEVLVEEFRRIQVDPALRRAVLAARLRAVPYLAGLILDGTSHAQPQGIDLSEVRASFIVDTLLDQVLDVTWTHIADSANLNYGTTAMLERIQEQLGEVLELLSEMSLAIGKQNLDNAVSDVYNQAISQIETYNSRLADLNLGNILAAPETPYTPTNDTQDLLSSMQSLAVEQNLRIIRNYMDPTTQGTKILVEGQSYILSDLYGQSLTADTGNFPFRNSDLVNQLFTILDYYSQYQQLGINLLGESAHIQTNPTNAIITAQRNAEETIDSLYRQRAVLPPSAKLPNNVVVDLQAGLMWYTVIQGSRSCSDAVSFANGFSLSDGAGGTYTDWHLPTLEEYRILRERARTVDSSLRDSGVEHDGSDSSSGNYGYSAQGLTTLGFTNASFLNSDGSVLYSYYLYSTVENKYILQGTGTFDSNPEFRFNHQNSDNKSTTNKRPFFVVRSIGKPVVPIASVVQNPYGLSFQSVDVDSNSASIPYEWSDVKGFEYELFGRVGGVQNQTFLTPKGSADGLPDRVGASLTYQFVTGGSFAVGGHTYPLTLPRRVHDSAAANISFPTYNGPANAYEAINTRNQLVSFASENPAAEVASTGRLRWRANGNGAFDLDLTASIYNTSGEMTPFPQSVRTSVSSPRKLTQIQMFPRNREYFLTSVASRDEQYYCLAFYADDTVEDVTNQVTWSAVDDSTGQPIAEAFFSTQANGHLTVTNTAPQFVRLSVSLGSSAAENDQTVIKAVTQ